jgi:hypothetical protein
MQHAAPYQGFPDTLEGLLPPQFRRRLTPPTTAHDDPPCTGGVMRGHTFRIIVPALRRRATILAAAGLALLPALASVRAQPPALPGNTLPFFVGESLSYNVRVLKMGNVGQGTMWIEGPVDVRGTDAYHLRFDFNARVGPFKAADRTESWIDPLRMAVLRFAKHERHPLSKEDQSVELFPDEKRWTAADGTSGLSPTDAPLDELSFIYFIRTLPLEPDSVYKVSRHFETGRNPVTIRALKREVVTTAAGTFHTILVEMRVKDARRYHGEGVIRLNFTDDRCRVPVRIESAMPVVGTAVFTLRAHSHPVEHQVGHGL